MGVVWVEGRCIWWECLNRGLERKAGAWLWGARSGEEFSGSRAGERAADQGLGRGFPKELAWRGVSCLALCFKGSLFSFLSSCPTFPEYARPRTSSQPAALITSFHFNSAELGACELKRKFTKNTRQIECASISEAHLTLSAPSCSLPLALPQPASDGKLKGRMCWWEEVVVPVE